jgi:DNA-binding response OmpR family regulator
MPSIGDSLATTLPRQMVLVVEDDPGLSSFYRSALQIAGFAVATAEDGVAALRHIDGAVPRAVVLDLGLPRLSGFDVGREVAAHLPFVPIVVVTGSTEAIDAAHFTCVLRKPITATTLIEAVESCLQRAGGRRPRPVQRALRLPLVPIRAVPPVAASHSRPMPRLRRRPIDC